ncbi:6-pyruvoyl tetrahydrobiopterin synthase [Smittium mucronatum]|uniref:6-pyruvoyl tetrahydrobiopterin synthase n=1 Tax=Smittium mucronatum TaxID=133383 RepID=A0A1R0GTD9_9FUNG|nr:6-pyruvoyl tetrahydrobiopterin synthase [Smittium mucronatum]
MVRDTMTVYFSRKEKFSSAHRLNSKNLTEEENLAVYGKCNHKNGHGHNYEIKVTIKGTIDPITGMCINLTDLKEAIQTQVLDLVDHKNLDLDVKFFKETPRYNFCLKKDACNVKLTSLLLYHISTAENICIFAWNQLLPVFGDSLYRIKVSETDKNSAEYRGE